MDTARTRRHGRGSRRAAVAGLLWCAAACIDAPPSLPLDPAARGEPLDLEQLGALGWLGDYQGWGT